MNIAYLIVAHKFPKMLQRLVHRLEAPWAHFYVHIDPQSTDYKELKKTTSSSSLQFIPSQKIHWADISQVDVTLSLIQHALQAHPKPDTLVLLSGQDYPIKPLHYIERFFNENQGISFIESFPLPTHKWKRGGLDRLEQHHFHLGNIPFSYPYDEQKHWLQILLNPFIRLIFKNKKRSLPKDIQFYGGSNWITLSNEAASQFIQYNKEHPAFRERFNYTRSGDEIFFQTIFHNLKQPLPHANKILHYCDWSLPFGPCPAILTTDWMDAIKSSDALFARKFDETIDTNVLDRIDAEIL